MLRNKSQNLLEKLKESKSIMELDQALIELCEYFNAGRFVLLISDFQENSLSTKIYSRFPQGFDDYYYQNNYYPHDPLFSNRGKIHLPFSWELKKEEGLSLVQKEICSLAYDFGIKDGTLIPSLPSNHGQIFLNILDFINVHPSILHILSIGLVIYEEKRSYLRQREKIQSFTDREREVLHLYSQGLALKSVAKLLGVSEHTVTFHLKNLRQKLGVNSSAQVLFVYGLHNIQS